MEVTLLLTFISMSLLQTLISGGPSSLTRFEYLPQKLPFTEARNVCHSMNMTLVEVKDKVKQLAVEQCRKMFHSDIDAKSSGNLGIGLVRAATGGENFTWVESRVPLTWANWDFPPVNITSRQCVKMASKSGKWHAVRCDKGRAYMCEQLSEEKCPYNVHPNLTLAADISELNRTSLEAELNECEELCNTFLSAEGKECWAFHTQPLSHNCSIFFTDDPFLVNNVSVYENSIHGTLYTKQCFYGCSKEESVQSSTGTENYTSQLTITGESEVSLKETIFSTGNPNMPMSTESTTVNLRNNPEKHAFTMSTSSPTYRTLTTVSQLEVFGWKTNIETESAITEIRPDCKTELTSPFSSENLTQSTDTSSPITSGSYYDSTSGNKVLSTSMTNSQKWRSTLSELMLSTNMTNVKGWSQPTSVSTKMNVTDQPEKSSSIPTGVKTIDVTVSATLRSCYCPCYRKTQINNHKFINAVITNLTVNKKNLSAERRKYYSVQDNRTLATGIGCTGVVILVLATSLVVCVDIFTLVEKLNGCRHR